MLYRSLKSAAETFRCRSLDVKVLLIGTSSFILSKRIVYWQEDHVWRKHHEALYAATRWFEALTNFPPQRVV